MNILDILFPKRCVGCKKIGEYVCAACFANISFDVKLICLGCGKAAIDGLTHPGCRTKFSIDGAFCALAYKKTVKRLVYVFKYQPYVFGMADFLARLMYESLIQQENFANLLQKAKPILVPIPLSAKKLRKRGYNQSLLLAQKLGKLLNLEVVDCLERVRDTKPQFGLKREERQENIREAFAYKSSVIPSERSESRDPNGISHLRQAQGRNDKCGKVALLIDDVLTTGTTLSEAAKVLKRNGFNSVYGVCLARDE